MFSAAVQPNDFALLVRIATGSVDQNSVGSNREIGESLIARHLHLVG